MSDKGDLLNLVESDDYNYRGYGPWEKFVPGRGGYDGSNYIRYDGNVTLSNDEKVKHVAFWNEFDEGEVWHVVVDFRDALYELVIHNDSWDDGGIELSAIYPVEAREVTKTEYVRA